jgi:integrase
MPKKANLSETRVRYAKARATEYSLGDGGGLFLRVSPGGKKSWLFNYFKPATGKRSNLQIGVYPDTTLAEARKKKDEYRALLAKGADPKISREQDDEKARQDHDNTFGAVFNQWLDSRRKKFSESYLKRLLPAMNLHVLPFIGGVPITQLSPPILKKCLMPLEDNGHHESLRKLLGWTNEVMNYSVNHGYVETNRLQLLRKEFTAPTVVHRPTIRPEELPAFMRDLEQASISLQTDCAIRWLLFTLVRPIEGASAEWSEIDLEKALWTIPAEKMKMRRDHIVPLVPQTLKVLEIMKSVSGHRRFIFPSSIRPLEHMNSETANAAIRRMGYRGKLVAHGLRALGSTTLNEQGFNPELIEISLAHVDKNSIRAAYNRGEYIERRRAMLAWWSDHVEEASRGKLTVASRKQLRAAGS